MEFWADGMAVCNQFVKLSPVLNAMTATLVARPLKKTMSAVAESLHRVSLQCKNQLFPTNHHGIASESTCKG